MSEELRARIDFLENEIVKLNSREGVIAAFNQYLYGIDTGFIDGILDAFTADSVLNVINFPPDGIDMRFEGREEMASLYERYQSRTGTISDGHNASNISLVIGEAPGTASLSAYFTTTRPAGIQGGRYEGHLVLEDDGKWRFSQLSIISAWGWKTDTREISDPVGIGRSIFEGKPASGFPQ